MSAVLTRTLAQAQHMAAKLLALRDKKAQQGPAMARYNVFIRSGRGYVLASTLEACSVPDACRQLLRAYFARTTTCAVVMRAPGGRRYGYADAVRVVEAGHV